MPSITKTQQKILAEIFPSEPGMRYEISKHVNRYLKDTGPKDIFNHFSILLVTTGIDSRRLALAVLRMFPLDEYSPMPYDESDLIKLA